MGINLQTLQSLQFASDSSHRALAYFAQDAHLRLVEKLQTIKGLTYLRLGSKGISMAQMEAPMQGQAQEAEDEQAGPLLLERLQVKPNETW